MHAYHNILVNDGEKKFYKHRKNQSGYSFVSDETGGALTSVKEIQENQQIFIHMSDGKVSTRVDGIEFIDREGSYEE